ncbi:HEPN domain-containing protein, partial [bacterium]|nr:HEPN domain-containing protein [bacterium]
MCKQENPELVVKEWLKRAEEDIKSAKIMLETNHYTWSAFICQQALEKCLKAGYVKKRNEIPPYIHKLERLCEILDIEPPEEILEDIIRIDKYYIVA